MPTKIEWTDETWNPIRGTKGPWHCVKVSEGCRNCYAERFNRRKGGPAYVKGADTLRLDEKVLEKPLHWKKPRLVFVCSMTDLFQEDVASMAIADVFNIMYRCPHHTFQILTKRPHRMKVLADLFSHMPLPNVWLGVSVENQATLDERLPPLLDTEAAVHFVSYEPALGPINFGAACDEWWTSQYQPFWVIAGGESGPGARPAHPDWFCSVRDQCQNNGIPFLFKQWGEWGPTPKVPPMHRKTVLVHLDGSTERPYAERSASPALMTKVGKNAAGRLLDGRVWDEFPSAVTGLTLGKKR
jgi:protein gp37